MYFFHAGADRARRGASHKRKIMQNKGWMSRHGGMLIAIVMATLLLVTMLLNAN